MAKRQVFHSPNTKEGWVVTSGGRVLQGFKYQAEAEAEPMKLGRKAQEDGGLGQPDGEVREKRTYGADPQKTPGESMFDESELATAERYLKHAEQEYERHLSAIAELSSQGKSTRLADAISGVLKKSVQRHIRKVIALRAKCMLENNSANASESGDQEPPHGLQQ